MCVAGVESAPTNITENRKDSKCGDTLVCSLASDSEQEGWGTMGEKERIDISGEMF